VDPRTHLVRLLRWVAFTAAANVTGAPALSLPAGRSRDGLPIGVQISASRGHERRLLELAFELDDALQ
jgi:amidase